MAVAYFLRGCLFATCNSNRNELGMDFYFHYKEILHTPRGNLKYNRFWINYKKIYIVNTLLAPRVKQKTWAET